MTIALWFSIVPICGNDLDIMKMPIGGASVNICFFFFNYQIIIINIPSLILPPGWQAKKSFVSLRPLSLFHIHEICEPLYFTLEV